MPEPGACVADGEMSRIFYNNDRMVRLIRLTQDTKVPTHVACFRDHRNAEKRDRALHLTLGSFGPLANLAQTTFQNMLQVRDARDACLSGWHGPWVAQRSRQLIQSVRADT